MSQQSAKQAFAAFGALFVWGSLALQLYLSIGLMREQGGGIAAALQLYFSYFTILTNILAAIVLTAAALGEDDTRFFRRPFVSTGVAVCIVMVGIIYFLVLRPLFDPRGLHFVADAGLHYFSPIFFFLYWLLFVPKGSLQWSDPFRWIVYPIAYFVYAMILGQIAGRYPYPFIDVNALGYGGVLRNAVMVTASFVAMGLIFVAIGKVIARR